MYFDFLFWFLRRLFVARFVLVLDYVFVVDCLENYSKQISNFGFIGFRKFNGLQFLFPIFFVLLQ